MMPRRAIRNGLLLSIPVWLVLLIAAYALPTRHSGGTRVPPAATSAGYLLNTFSTQGNFTTGTVDKSITYTSGFQWYATNFFSDPPSPDAITLNADGSMSLTGGGHANGVVGSLAQIVGAPFYVGTAFGGGLYAEAELSFNPNTVDVSLGWPAWWSMALEHLVNPGVNDQWAGQAAGYEHFIENDFFEFLNGMVRYGATLHDWYGIYNVTCPPSFCHAINANNSIAVESGTDWNLFHRFGMLWIPATGAVQGTVSYYFDDVLMATTRYDQFTTQDPPPPGSAWTFGVMDSQHLVLLLGNGIGASVTLPPMTIRSVNVWQASTAGNLTN